MCQRPSRFYLVAASSGLRSLLEAVSKQWTGAPTGLQARSPVFISPIATVRRGVEVTLHFTVGIEMESNQSNGRLTAMGAYLFFFVCLFIDITIELNI